MRQPSFRGLAIALSVIASVFVNNAQVRPPQTAVSSQVSEFLRLARSELVNDNTCAASKEYLRGLPLKQRLLVARAIINDPDARIGYLGANILIAHGYARNAVPALAAILVSGRDQTQLNGRFGYEWLHSGDDTLFPRLIIKINRYLLANLTKYAGEERGRVEDLLMGGLYWGKPTEAFSQAKAKKLISEWESELRGRR